jgi:hypothetical protein
LLKAEEDEGLSTWSRRSETARFLPHSCCSKSLWQQKGLIVIWDLKKQKGVGLVKGRRKKGCRGLVEKAFKCGGSAKFEFSVKVYLLLITR